MRLQRVWVYVIIFFLVLQRLQRGKTRGAHAVPRRPVPPHHLRAHDATAAAKRYRPQVVIVSNPHLSTPRKTTVSSNQGQTLARETRFSVPLGCRGHTVTTQRPLLVPLTHILPFYWAHSGHVDSGVFV